MKRLTSLLFLLIYIGVSATALPVSELRLPAIFQNGMVLQRLQPVHVWGQAPAGQAVEARIIQAGTSKGVLSSQVAEAAADGTFSLYLPPLNGGGPYTLIVSAGNQVRICREVWMGEVWLCSGQSNMELRVSETNTRAEDLSRADTLSRLHLYNMESLCPLYAVKWSASLADSIDSGHFIRPARWERCSAQAAAHFSAIGFSFGRMLADSLGCHVALICNAVGGSTTEGWIDSLSLKREVPEMLRGSWLDNDSIMLWARDRARYNLQLVGAQGHTHPYEPGYLYRAAIAPIAGFTLRGVLWYQGESNAELVSLHERLFPLLERSWRTAWADSLLPFYTVQLSSISTRPTWPAFRDSQRRLALRLPHTWMTVCSDVGDSLDVHPRQKRIVGQRLARQALCHTYGHTGVVPSGPEPLRAVTDEKGRVTVDFALARGLHFATAARPEWFELRGADGRWHPALTVTTGQPGAHAPAGSEGSVFLSTPRVPRPTAVRYAWTPFTRASLQNGASMPCSTFSLSIVKVGK